MVKNYDIEKDETNISDDPKENVKAVSGSLDKIQRILKDIKKKEFNLKDKEGKSIDLSSTISTTQSDITTANANISTAQSDISTAQSDISTAQSDITALQSENGLKPIYWKKKFMSSPEGFTTAEYLEDLTFSDVESGTYRVSWNLTLNVSGLEFNTSFSASRVELQVHHGSTVLDRTQNNISQVDASSSGANIMQISSIETFLSGSLVFTAGSTQDLKFEVTEHMGGTSQIVGGYDEDSWATIEELPNHTDTDRWD